MSDAVERRTLQVYRWSPGQPARWQDYEVAVGPDTTVLDALVDVQRTQDPTLVFRYACRVGMCGSCGMVIGGRERWACRTRLSTLGSGPVRVRPLYHFPLLGDLVVDMAPFNVRMRAVGAAFQAAPAPPGHAVIPGDSAERQEIDAAIECIGCGLCLSACTMVAHNPRFPGPAALNRALTLQRDSRDAGAGARWAVLLSDDALARCHGQGGCTEVCPMALSPMRSIIRLRQMGARHLLGRAIAMAMLVVGPMLPVPVAAQPQGPPPYVVTPPAALAAAPWSLSADDRRATIVAGLPAMQRYRVCNDSNTLAFVMTDTHPGFDLPGRSCADVAAKTVTVMQRVSGIPAYGTYLRLD
jgi:fumarate reductase iron-sulfur subunit